LLLGTCLGAPAILALSYANYGNRGPLLLSTKSLQLAIFVFLSVVLIQRLGLLGAAIALVSSDVIAQSGVLFVIVVTVTLRHPIRHTLLLMAMMVTIVSAGVAVGETIRLCSTGIRNRALSDRMHVWVVVVALLASPLMSRRIRKVGIPR
jgi:O-antigen/teichoic acid export membrane protein